MPAAKFDTATLSKESLDIAEYLPQYKEFRLEGLQRHPDSFATCFQCELKKSRTELESMLAHPTVQVVVCTPAQQNPPAASHKPWGAHNAEWAAMMQLHGPAFASPEDEVKGELDMSWCISGGYIRDSYRGSACILRGLEHTMRRVVQQLKDEYFRQSETERIGTARARIQLWVVADSPALLRHYEMMNFTVIRHIPGEYLVEDYACKFPMMRGLCCHNYLGRDVALMEMTMEFNEQQLLTLEI